MAEKHPELVVAYLKGMIKVGRWANDHKHAAAAKERIEERWKKVTGDKLPAPSGRIG